MEDNHSQSRTFIAGIVLGGLVGAATALLLSPKSGPALRKDLRRTYDEVTEGAHDLAHAVSKKSHKYANQLSGQAEEWTDKVRDFLEVVSDGVSHFTDTAQKEARHIKDETHDQLHSKLQSVIDIASVGLNLWKSVGSKRR